MAQLIHCLLENSKHEKQTGILWNDGHKWFYYFKLCFTRIIFNTNLSFEKSLRLFKSQNRFLLPTIKIGTRLLHIHSRFIAFFLPIYLHKVSLVTMLSCFAITQKFYYFCFTACLCSFNWILSANKNST